MIPYGIKLPYSYEIPEPGLQNGPRPANPVPGSEKRL
jgi:hypothetical protein